MEPVQSWPATRVGHSVLFRSERYVLLRSKKRTLRSFPFFSRVFGDLWDPKERYVLFRSFLKNGKEQKERNVLLQRTEKNGKNVTFFCKERKRTERTFHPFIKNGKNIPSFYKERKRTERTFRPLIKNRKERKERNILLERTEKNGKNWTFF